MWLTMDVVENALTHDWETTQVIAGRLGVPTRRLNNGGKALGALVVRRRALRREIRVGSSRYEYRLV